MMEQIIRCRCGCGEPVARQVVVPGKFPDTYLGWITGHESRGDVGPKILGADYVADSRRAAVTINAATVALPEKEDL